MYLDNGATYRGEMLQLVCTTISVDGVVYEVSLGYLAGQIISVAMRSMVGSTRSPWKVSLAAGPALQQ